MAKERPILFSTPMVQAILQGRKTQTRRIVKEPIQGWMNDTENPKWWEYITDQCPYGHPGDLLWVRESFTWVGKKEKPLKYLYAAEPTHDCMRWRPSIHMPKDASRIWLRITDVRVERLQAITEADAIAEGIEVTEDPVIGTLFKKYDADYWDFPYHTREVNSFQSLWETIHGKESWLQNPWVWVLSFEVVSTTGRKEENL